MDEIMRSSDVVRAWGVNASLTFANAYANTDLIVTELNYLGVDHIRTLVQGTDDYAQSVFHQVAADGIKFDLIASTGGDQDLSAIMRSFDAIAQNNPGSIASVEGSNEINIWPISFDGIGGLAAGLPWQQALYDAVKSDPNLAGVPVIDLTLGGGSSDEYQALGNLSAYADYGNVHLYPSDPSSPISAPASYIIGADSYAQYANQATPNLPIVMTEFGYYTTPDDQGGLPQEVQEKYELNALFDAMKAGMAQVYLYELMDGDPTDTHGLFQSDGTPKQSAIGLHNLTAILHDAGADAGSFTPGSLNVSVSDLPATGNSLVMEKSNGAFDIAVWSDANIWDVSSVSENQAPTSTVTVDLGATFASVQVYDPLNGTDPIQTLSDVSQVQLALTDHPLIVETGSGSTPATSPPASNAPSPPLATSPPPVTPTDDSSATETPAAQPATSDGPSLSTPVSEATTVYGSVNVTGVSVSDPLAADPATDLSVDLSDLSGTLMVNGDSYPAGASAHFIGSVDAVNAALATLSYQAGNVPTSDNIAITVQDGAGNTAAASIPIAVGNLEIDVPASQDNVTLDQDNTILVGADSAKAVFLNGSYDTLVLSGGPQTIQETGNNNVFVIPPAGQGFDDISGVNLAEGDSFNFSNALAAAGWDGVSDDLANHLAVQQVDGDTVISVGDISGGVATPVLVLEGTTLDMSQLLASSQLT